jgi:hypothetical protein
MNRKIKGKRSRIEYAFKLYGFITFPQLGITLSNQVKEELQYQWLVLPSVVYGS